MLLLLLLTTQALAESALGIANWKPWKYDFLGKGCLRGEYNTYTGKAGTSPQECSRVCHVNKIGDKFCGYFTLIDGKCHTGTSISLNGSKKSVWDVHPCGFLMPDEDVYHYTGVYTERPQPCRCLVGTGCTNEKDYCNVHINSLCKDKEWSWSLSDMGYISKEAKSKCVADAQAITMKSGSAASTSTLVNIFAAFGLAVTAYGAFRFYTSK